MDDRPKTLRCRDAVADAERVIVDALPDVLAGLVERAKAGDTKAATYLVDRVLGKTAGSKIAPADDQSLPFNEADYPPPASAGGIARPLRPDRRRRGAGPAP
jgi:hypothetical protein